MTGEKTIFDVADAEAERRIGEAQAKNADSYL